MSFQKFTSVIFDSIELDLLQRCIKSSVLQKNKLNLLFLKVEWKINLSENYFSKNKYETEENPKNILFVLKKVIDKGIKNDGDI